MHLHVHDVPAGNACSCRNLASVRLFDPAQHIFLWQIIHIFWGLLDKIYLINWASIPAFLQLNTFIAYHMDRKHIFPGVYTRAEKVLKILYFKKKNYFSFVSPKSYFILNSVSPFLRGEVSTAMHTHSVEKGLPMKFLTHTLVIHIFPINKRSFAT